MKFTVIITSRERPQLLQNCINSIRDTARDMSSVEIIVMSDSDDQKTTGIMSQIVGGWKNDYPNVIWEARERSEWMHRDYINYGIFKYGTGKYVISINDDTTFATKGWDAFLWDKLEKYLEDKPDGIVYGSLDDDLPKENKADNRLYCCFPLISRKAIDAMGFMFDNEYKAWNADIAIYYAYDAVGRILDLKEVKINHICFHNGTRERDHISQRVQVLSEDRISPVYFLARDTKLLQDCIEGAKCQSST